MNVAILAGSARRESASTKVARYIGKRLNALGHNARVFDLRETPLPLYDPDEDAVPEPARALAQLVAESDAVVLATPEYHGSLSGVLKNALDYLGAEEFDGKVVLSVSAAGGAVGVSSLTHLQTIVRNLHGINCPDWISVGGDQRRFDAEGNPLDERMRLRIENVLETFVRMSRQLSASIPQP
ncbi:NADPH-dependent FMN reductase [Cohnella sp. CFH 77786]|uniref:NADPH-dependent FMN reductase n=1 Tax=Cohnella sp. CFH 77786 TaxID=2662265 RepID=UPI001C60CD8C|nr:NADPH-dependent FMN reductase [Cohnella sp. CFH 77786]MBW5445073.1 NADPH-dependent FMN reductase [Cohnella sp. CFH 77786]